MLAYCLIGATFLTFGGLLLEEILRLPYWLRPVTLFTRVAEIYLNRETEGSDGNGAEGANLGGG